jgi:hypothetical protein
MEDERKTIFFAEALHDCGRQIWREQIIQSYLNWVTTHCK